MNGKNKFPSIYRKLGLESRALQLWLEHGALTHMVLVAKVNNAKAEEEKALVERLLRNQDEIAMLFIPKFGRKVAMLVADLLREHIDIAAKIIDSLIGRLPATETAALIQRWGENGQEIMDALYKLDRNFMAKEEWRMHMSYDKRRIGVPGTFGHLDILSRHVQNYIRDRSLAEFDAYLAQIGKMAKHITQLVDSNSFFGF